MAKKKESISDQAPVIDKQILFAGEYVIDFNGTRAYKAIYGKDMSDDVAASAASRALRTVKVRSEIERLLQDPIGRRNETRERVLRELEQIAYDPGEIDINYDKDGKVLSVSRRDKLKACELLGKTAAMFIDKTEISGSLGFEKISPQERKARIQELEKKRANRS